MNASPFTRHLLLAVIAAAGLRAEEKSPPASAPGEDVIAVAKRDYGVINATRSSLEQQQLNIPKVSSPSLQLTPTENSTMPELNQSLRKHGQLTKPGKSANWLLEAMNETEKDKGGNAKKAASFDELKAELFPGEKEQEKLMSVDKNPLIKREDSKVPVSTHKLAESVENPLTSYMSSWMTPHDFELLKVKNPEPGLAVPIERSLDRPVAGNLFEGLTRVDSSIGGGRPTSPAALESRPNPYLADLTLGVPSAGVRELMSLPAPSGPSYAPPAATIPPPAKNDPGPGRNQFNPIDPLKSQDDAKYFPQLKRF